MPYRISVHFQIFTVGTSSLAPYISGRAFSYVVKAHLYHDSTQCRLFRCSEGGHSPEG